tara:strand:+ start:506 stop:622 length:117 start_codon:yes stop_codon:yes gene_type:complete
MEDTESISFEERVLRRVGARSPWIQETNSIAKDMYIKK